MTYVHNTLNKFLASENLCFVGRPFCIIFSGNYEQL